MTDSFEHEQTEHLDDEQLGDVLDGLADGHDHLDGCAACRDRLAALRAVTALVAELPPPVDELQRRRTIAAAMAAATATPASGRSARRLALLSAAALLIVVAGVVGIARSSPSGPDQKTAASRAGDASSDKSSTEAGPSEDFAAGSRAPTAANAPVARPLQPLDDDAVVEARARELVPGPTDAPCRDAVHVDAPLLGTFVGARNGETVTVLVFDSPPGRRAVVTGPACEIRLDLQVPPQP